MHYEVRFTVRLPEGVCATQREVEDWLRFNLRDTGSLDNKNQLTDYEPEPLRGTFRVFQTAGYATARDVLAKNGKKGEQACTKTGTPKSSSSASRSSA